jgi:hypothetical protein
MALTTDYDLSKSDWDFVQKLSKVGYVRVFSRQVTVRFDKENNELGGTKEKLIFPSNWSLQYIGGIETKYESNSMVYMTWEVLKA